MPLRDLFLFGIMAVGVPFILRHPWIGVLYWVWFGLMNPHRQSWGPAYDFKFAMIIAILTAIGMVITRDERRWKGGVEVYLLMAFVAWMGITTLFAFYPDSALPMLDRAVKIQLFIFFALILLNSKRQLDFLVWTIALSIGYYGVKGGLFTLRTGGEIGRVFGPAGSFIEDNNAIGLAIVIVIPYLYYLFVETKNRWIKAGLVVAAGLCVLAALGTYSRGAFLAISAMATLLWWRSRHKLSLALGGLALVPVLIAFLPDKWEGRMQSITEYEADTSAMGRLNSWQAAINLARDRPLVGGGFEFHSAETFARYAPVPEAVRSMHSIYFQVLGEHGFVGLALFLGIWFFTWRTSASLRRATRGRQDLQWANNLVAMMQVSLVGYLVGGAFLNLAYWDLPYYSLAILVITREIVRRSLAVADGVRADSAAAASSGGSSTVFPKVQPFGTTERERR